MASIGYVLQNYDFFCEKNCFIAKFPFYYVLNGRQYMLVLGSNSTMFFSLKKMLVYVFL